MSQPAHDPRERAMVLLIAVQHPEMDLGRLNQVLSSRGLTPSEQPSADEQNPRWTFRTLDAESSVELCMLLELGVYRVVARGAEAPLLAQLLPQYLPVLSQQRLAQQLAVSQSDDERKALIALLVLSFTSPDDAMHQIGRAAVDSSDEAAAAGLVDGLVLMDSAEAAATLDALAQEHADRPLGQLAAEGHAELVARGVAGPRRDPAALLDEALACADADPERALALLDEADAAGLRDPRLPLTRGRVLRQLGRLDEARAAYTDALRFGPSMADALVGRARCHERAGDPARALKDIEAALARDPRHVEARAARARLQLDDDVNSDAASRLSRLEAALAEHPDDPDLRVKRAAARLEAGDPDGALVDVEHAASLDPADARLAPLRVEAHLARGAYLSALRALAPEINALPPALQPQAELQPGRVYLALDEPERARRAFADVRRRLPDLPEAALGLGLALELLTRADEARARYDEALAGADAPALEARLRPVLFSRPAAWDTAVEAHGQTSTLPLTPRPERRVGVDTIDPFFKYCLSCGATALARRSTCKECSGDAFLTAS